MKEAIFTGEFRQSLEKYFDGAFCYKVPDQARFAGEMTRFAPVRPFDLFMVYQGKFIAYEMKQIKTLSGFSFDRVAEHQRAYLLAVKKAGGQGYIVVNYRTQEVSEKIQKKYGLESPRFNAAYLWDIDAFLELERTVSGNSLPFATVMASGFKIERKSGFWDLEKAGTLWGFRGASGWTGEQGVKC